MSWCSAHLKELPKILEVSPGGKGKLKITKAMSISSYRTGCSPHWNIYPNWLMELTWQAKRSEVTVTNSVVCWEEKWSRNQETGLCYYSNNFMVPNNLLSISWLSSLFIQREFIPAYLRDLFFGSNYINSIKYLEIVNSIKR